MRSFRRARMGAVCAALLLGAVCFTGGSVTARADGQAVILFTHDLHSHLLPTPEDDGGEYGGYARLKTVIDQEKEDSPEAVLLDGGDFSMGSLFQVEYTTKAIELQMMSQLGYDATTFGNHEYDYLDTGLADMLNAAVEAGETKGLTLPAIVEGNYLPPREGEEGYDQDSEKVWEAFESYGVADYVLFERGGIYYAVFGINGYDSAACSPNSGMVLEEPAQAAARIVEEATGECRELYGEEPLVVCLSHCGTEDGKGEDYELAREVPEIDVIISGHTHTTLDQPIQVGSTYIVSAGEYGKNLGKIVLDFSAEEGKAELEDYELTAIDESVEEDEETAALIESFKTEVEEGYLSSYGMKFDQVLAENPYIFDSVEEVYATQHDSALCSLFADAYKWAAEETQGEAVDMAVTAAGVIRESLAQGPVTVSDVFNAASLGVGTEGELVRVWLTGRDLKNVLEVDASVQPLMPAAQLFCSGVEYSFNTRRMIFNKVDTAFLCGADGAREEIQDDELYSIVTGMYCGQMLGEVENKSYGLLTVTPRDADGNPVDMDNLEPYLVRDDQGKPLKEWYAIASYISQMGGTIDQVYAAPDGRKTVYASLAPVDLLRNANRYTYIVIAVFLLLAVLIVLLIRGLRRLGRRHRAKKEGTSVQTGENKDR